MKTVLLQAAVLRAVTGKMCLLKSKFTGCDFNETVFKDTCVSAVFAAICQSEQGVLRQVILDETRLTDSN